jgi:hypothetical protein
MRTTSVGAVAGSVNLPLTTSRSPATSAAVVGTLKSASVISSTKVAVRPPAPRRRTTTDARGLTPRTT